VLKQPQSRRFATKTASNLAKRLDCGGSPPLYIANRNNLNFARVEIHRRI
jgi:hypothetical protein